MDGELRAALLAWYDAHARDLPWRRGATPYGTLVSEVMLQQTRVETVVPYYERWLARFPDVGALARAHEDDVLRAWEGLGYYSRARNLHRTARVVRERYSGELPDDYASLRELPGIGDYTAGAVASIAFGRREPAVDGNAKRVLARVFDLEMPSAVDLRKRAAALIDPDRPGDFNQALMELGATVCTARSPACKNCPVGQHCLARARGTSRLRPAPRGRATVPAFDLLTVVVMASDHTLLLRRRPQRGLLAGLWEFPSTPLLATPDPEEQARRLVRQLTSLDPLALAPAALAPVAHVFSHRRERYHPYLLRAHAAPPALIAPDCKWVERKELRQYPMPRAQRRVQEAALAPELGSERTQQT